MTDENKHGNTTGNGGYERQDLQVSGILYFLLTIVVGAAICMAGLRGVFAVLDHREKASQPPVNPLATNVPTDTRHIVPGYPQSVFPNPKLEEDERGQLNGIVIEEERTLNSYGWVDEKAGTVRIPIKRAMELIVQRGLPARLQGTGGDRAAATDNARAAKTGMAITKKARRSDR
jgi:hypothetical protein